MKKLVFFCVLLLWVSLASAQTISNIQGRRVERALLLNAAAATTNGVWIGVEGFQWITVEVNGITTATVTCNVSTAEAMPSNATARTNACTLTADGMCAISTPVRWIKCGVLAYTSGTITATMEAVQ
jgi:hypothetical protein